MAILLLVIGILLFVGLVVVHEFGHFIIARRNGVEVEEFGIGFPPKAWGKHIKPKKGDKNPATNKGFLFSINWLPLGGFVRLKGEHDADTEPGTFGAASTWAKTKIMAAGVGMNLLVAIVLFMVLAWIGMPRLIDHQFTVARDTHIVKSEVLVGAVQAGSPAAKAGIQQRDQVVAIGRPGQTPVVINNTEKLTDTTQRYSGEIVTVQYIHNGQEKLAQAHLLSDADVAASKKTANPKGHLGVSPAAFVLQRSTWSAPIVALGITRQFTVLTFHGLGTALAALFHGNTAQASAQVSGPVGIFVVLKDGSMLGYQFMLMIVAIISLSLAIMNVLPIPALDGGKLFVTYISRLLHKRVSETVEDYVYGASFIFLLGLMLLITIVDVKRFF